jgi:hypothetical protein
MAMTNVRNAIEFIQSDIDQLINERDCKRKSASAMNERADRLDEQILHAQELIARYEDRFPSQDKVPDGPDPQLVAMRNKPYTAIIEYLGDKHNGKINLRHAYEELHLAGFPVGKGTGLRTRLSTSPNWKNIGRGRWHRVEKAEIGPTHHRQLAIADTVPIPVKGSPIGYCMKCRSRSALTNVFKTIAKNGRHMNRGQCSVCGTGIAVFVKAA